MRTLAVVFVVLALVPAALAAVPSDRDVEAVARELRCVVCQNLSVADSPSEMARQMRDVVREQLASGRTPDEIKSYFVARYGEWVLLSPPTRGFGLLAWVLPLGALGAGTVLALVILIRWRRRGAAAADADDGVDEEALLAVRAEMERRTR